MVKIGVNFFKEFHLLTYIEYIYKYVIVISLTLVFNACGTSTNEGVNSVESGTKQFISAKVLDDINTSTMLSVVKSSIDPTATNAFGYKAVEIIYNTLGQNDEPIIASGLLVIPTASETYKAYLSSLGKAFSISMICDNHGTIFTDAEAPTNVEKTNGLPDYSVAVLMTGFAGFAAILPDYIGYGISNSVAHPYMLKKSSARSSLDMIKASMKYMSDSGIVLNYQLYISGYSEGGYDAMALAEEIEKGFFSNINLMGIAPMAGPYNLEKFALNALNSATIMPYPAFLAYVADSYSYYNDSIILSELVNEVNTTLYHSLFDGSKSAIEIQTALGLVTDARAGFNQHSPDVLFKASFLNDYQVNLNNSLRVKFAKNRVDNWVPKTRMNLIQCVDDDIIPFSMSQDAYNTFISNGMSASKITLSPIPTSILAQQQDATHPFIHSNCGNTAYASAVKWFADIRQGKI